MKKRFFKILIPILFVILLFVFCLLYFRILDPLWNPFRPEPDQVMEEVEKNFERLKTYKQDSEIKISFKNEEEKILKGNLLIARDKTETENQRMKIDFNFNYFGEGKEYSLSGENILFGQNNFIKFDQFPPIEFFAQLGFYPQQIKNRWIKFDFETIKELLKSIESQLEISGLVENFEKSEIFQKEIQGKLKNLFFKKKLYLVKKELPDERINGKKFYHYALILNKKEVKNLLPEIIKIYSEGVWKSIPEKFQPKPEEKEKIITNLIDKINEIFEKIGEIEAEIWVEKKDLLIYKIEIKKEVDLAQVINWGGSLDFRLITNFSQFNEIVNINFPAEFSTIKEIFEDLFSPMIKWLQIQKRDEKRKKDLQSIKKAFDIYYNIYKTYPASKTLPGEIKIKIEEKEECLFENCQAPKDPGGGPCKDYQLISNLKNPQKFCLFACLENGKFFAISHKGEMELDEAPKTLDCW